MMCGICGKHARFIAERNVWECDNRGCRKFGRAVGGKCTVEAIGTPPTTAGTAVSYPSPLEGKFEPEAKDCRDPMTAAATSIAVSLKRIADALDKHDSPNNVADTLFGIMMNGRQ